MKEELENELPEELMDDLSFLGTGDNVSKYVKYYYTKASTKKGVIPSFKFKRMVDGRAVDVKGTQPSISGKLTKITFGSYNFEGTELKTTRFQLETLNEIGDLVGISWGCGWNSVLINLVNCLLKETKPVESLLVSLYQDKNSGFNKSMFRINGKKPEWKYSIDELNDKKEKIFNKKGELVKTETGELVDFLEYELKNHLPIILPNFKPEDEVVKHQVNIIEEDIETVLPSDKKGKKDEVDEALQEFFDFNSEDPTPSKGTDKKKK